MRALILTLAVVACCSAILIGPAAASTSPTNTSSTSQHLATYDPFLKAGDLLTKAVPVCCCSSGNIVCEEAPPGTSCKQGSICVCNTHHACALP